MGRPRTPTKKLELAGAFKKNPNRRRPAEPMTTGPLGDPPKRMPAKVRAFWSELVSSAAQGVLTISDRWVVERASRLMEMACNRPHEFTCSHEAQLRGYLSSMGFDPAARSKLSVATAKPKNAFADLAEEAKSFVQRPN